MSSLVAFKRLHNDNVPLEQAIPRFVEARPHRYRGLWLRDLCAEMHALFRESNVSDHGADAWLIPPTDDGLDN